MAVSASAMRRCCERAQSISSVLGIGENGHLAFNDPPGRGFRGQNVGQAGHARRGLSHAAGARWRVPHTRVCAPRALDTDHSCTHGRPPHLLHGALDPPRRPPCAAPCAMPSLQPAQPQSCGATACYPLPGSGLSGRLFSLRKGTAHARVKEGEDAQIIGVYRDVLARVAL